MYLISVQSNWFSAWSSSSIIINYQVQATKGWKKIFEQAKDKIYICKIQKNLEAGSYWEWKTRWKTVVDPDNEVASSGKNHLFMV